MHLILNLFRSRARLQRRGRLEDYPPVVITFVDQMDCDAGLPFPCGSDRLMDMSAIHPLPSEFRQQGGMDVYDAVMVTRGQESGEHKQESGQHYRVDRTALQHPGEPHGIVEFLPAKYLHLDPQTVATPYHPRPGIVADHHSHSGHGTRRFLEIPYDVLGIGAVA